MNLSFSIEEVCRLTGLGRTKIYEAINKGLLPAKKYGKRTIILKSDLESFLDNLKSYQTVLQTKNRSRIGKIKKSEN